jgi:hypothetical protein
VQACDRAVAFLIRRQLPGGEFSTFAARSSAMEGRARYGSPFLTTFILFALRNYAGSNWPAARNRALQFLRSEQEPGGWWRNHNRLNPLHTEHQLPLDLDDTAVVSQILTYYDLPFEDNRPAIRGHTDERGLFLTWIQPPFANEVDPIVNANVLFYLGDAGLPAARRLAEWLTAEAPNSEWYPDRLALLYVVSRAYASGIDSLGDLGTNIVPEVLARQVESGGFGSDLSTALALNTLANYGYREPAFTAGLEHLLRRQAPEGSWAIAPFYRGWKMFYGSEELTTALAVEALLRP